MRKLSVKKETQTMLDGARNRKRENRRCSSDYLENLNEWKQLEKEKYRVAQSRFRKEESKTFSLSQRTCDNPKMRQRHPLVCRLANALVFLAVPFATLQFYLLHVSETQMNLDTPLSTPPDFLIVVLTMNRAKSLQRLLNSIAATDYGQDDVAVNIRIDGSESTETQRVAASWEWPSHLKTITVNRQRGGLRSAWLNAWEEPNPHQHAVILEDDVELSPLWYSWLSAAWKTYGSDCLDMAGITLQRQVLIPRKPHKQSEIKNGHVPFLYKLVGSIGFSPDPQHWKNFLMWVDTIDDLDTFDADVPG